VILVCGEALIDLYVQPDAALGPILKATVGGSPLNVAIGLARLGTDAAFLGGVSTDHFGTLLVQAMSEEGIDISLLKRSARPTPLVLVAPDAGGHPSYTFYAHESAECDLIFADMPVRLPAAINAIALGSYALAADPIGTALLTLAEREAHRLVICLDCNLRPAMVGPLDRWRDRIERFARCAAIIKLSEEDFVAGWGENADLGDHVSRWLTQGAQLIVMTHGANGATAWHRCGRLAIPGQRAQVVDTVGAGDSFQAGLLARLAQKALLSRFALTTLDRASIEDAMHYANITAAMTCGRRGADAPQRAEVDAAMVRAGRIRQTATATDNPVENPAGET
jgi:fructokinase